MAALCWRCFQIHFLLLVCQIFTGFGTEHCISYWGTRCHYHVQHIYKNRLWGKFREMYSSVTSEGLVPWWWPSCARSNLLIYWVPLSSCPREHFSRGHSQPSTASNLLWSPTLFSGLFVVLLPSLTASEYWKKQNARKSASDQANHEEANDASPWLPAIQYGACINP